MYRRFFLLTVTSAVLSGCSKQSPAPELKPLPFSKHDRCHICGMVILNYPGAKAQIFIKNEKEPLKFCSVKDGFTFILQPENARRAAAFFVSDFGNSTEAQLHEKMLSAKDAFYVAGSDVHGAMGKTILPFKTKDQAQAFMREHGGKLLSYTQVTLEEIKALKGH